MSTQEFTKAPQNDAQLKSCCANFYENKAVSFFLGDSFHPGGIELTIKLAQELGISKNKTVLDIASGKGSSAIAIASQLGASVTGLDFSNSNSEAATRTAQAEGVEELTKFIVGDAEQLPFPDNSFDAVICECAYCTFPDKTKAASEIARILKPGGMLGLSDIIINEPLPDKWNNYISHILCVADAKSFAEYNQYFTDVGFIDIKNIDERDVLLKLADQLKAKLMLAQIAIGLGKISIKNFSVAKGKEAIKEGREYIEAGKGSYGLIIAKKPLG